MEVPGAMELSGLGVSAARYVIGGGAAGVPLSVAAQSGKLAGSRRVIVVEAE